YRRECTGKFLANRDLRVLRRAGAGDWAGAVLAERMACGDADRVVALPGAGDGACRRVSAGGLDCALRARRTGHSGATASDGRAGGDGNVPVRAQSDVRGRGDDDPGAGGVVCEPAPGGVW